MVTREKITVMNRTLKISSILLVLLLSACNDDFMDRLPETEIGTENFFNTEEDLSIYIYSLYNFPIVSAVGGTGGFHTQMYAFDAYHTTDNANNTGNTELKSMMIGTPSSSTLTEGWWWSQLRDINLFLENFSNADIPEESLDHFEGQARFFRARFYYHMVKRYSDLPWYEEAIETGDEESLTKPRDSRDFVVGKIFEDFDFAVNHVKEDQLPGAVDKWTVMAYAARAALHEGTFRKYHPELNLTSSADNYLEYARDYSRELMDNGGFSIYSTGDPMSDYQTLFSSVDLAGNPEVIFHIICEDGVVNNSDGTTEFGEYEICPSKDLLQDYLMDDGTPFTSIPGYDTLGFVAEFQNRDPRLYQSYAYPGWEIVYTSTYATGPPGPYIQSLSKNFTGYHQIKGFPNTLDLPRMRSIDIPVIRLAEVLLIYAEARAELGELTQADLDLSINRLRDRAGMPPLMMGTPADPVQQAKYPLVTGSTPAWQELLEIRRERRIELAFEGRRYDDLYRWNCGRLVENEPEGIFFPGLGKYDLTGDGYDDIILIDVSESIPAQEDKEMNELGVVLRYYRVGLQDSDADLYLENGNSGNVEGIKERGTFLEPKYYYRPIPETQVLLNPNLEQIFGWD